MSVRDFGLVSFLAAICLVTWSVAMSCNLQHTSGQLAELYKRHFYQEQDRGQQ